MISKYKIQWSLSLFLMMIFLQELILLTTFPFHECFPPPVSLISSQSSSYFSNDMFSSQPLNVDSPHSSSLIYLLLDTCWNATALQSWIPNFQPSSSIWSEIQSSISIPIDSNSHKSIWNFKPNTSGPSSDFYILTNGIDILSHAVKRSPLLLCAPTLPPKWVTSDHNSFLKTSSSNIYCFPP